MADLLCTSKHSQQIPTEIPRKLLFHLLSNHEQKFLDLWLNQYYSVPPDFLTIENSLKRKFFYEVLLTPQTKHVFS